MMLQLLLMLLAAAVLKLPVPVLSPDQQQGLSLSYELTVGAVNGSRAGRWSSTPAIKLLAVAVRG
jgi:hypothetical protein